MSDAVSSLIAGEPREANVSALNAELAALWRSAAEESESHNAVIRACALTLVIYTESEEAAHDVSQLLGALTLQNPCRALIMVVRPDDSPAGLSAWISAVCQLPAPGEKQVCCEHITIVARGDAVRDLDKVVVPLMVSGLPVYAWWRTGCTTQPEPFENIMRYVDRVILDSGLFLHPATDLAAVSERIQAAGGQRAICDLNWARITPWRELLAQCFDSEDTRPFLQRINEVRIEYSEGGANLHASLGQSLLFTAWLASRLGWQPTALERREATSEVHKGESVGRPYSFTGQAGDIQVELIPRRGGRECAAGFLSLELKTAGDPPATFWLACGGDLNVVITRIEMPGRQPIERTVRLRVLDEIGLLNEELKFPNRDRLYEEVLGAVALMEKMETRKSKLETGN